MFKKLILVLTLVLCLGFGSALACEPDTTATLIKGMKVIQIMPDKSFKGVIVPDDIDFAVGPHLNEAVVANLNGLTGMDWSNGHIGLVLVDFGQGPTPVMLFVKDGDIKDCK